ncbi:MAG: ferritin-like domain-containing protein [Sphingobacteriales bacterium]|nr:ferritin-like domain-containing protein [Sphingobacteriales bacterium]
MNLQNIISEIEKADPEVFEKLDTRRKVMKGFANLSGKIALASLPLAVGSMFSKAYGQSTSTITDVLQFALTLEYLEAEFYTTGLASSGLIVEDANGTRTAISTISAHETEHVNFLKTVITSLGVTPISKPTFDFSGGNGSGTGPFAGAFSNIDLFLAVAQVLEDTGVRAYKGQAPNLMSNNTVLTAALNIHSVEARHASRIRKLRKDRNSAAVSGTLKPWITLNDSNIIAPYNSYVTANYAGEENTTQSNVSIVNIGGKSISANAASEAFDEPLTKEQILAIVDPFIV